MQQPGTSVGLACAIAMLLPIAAAAQTPAKPQSPRNRPGQSGKSASMAGLRPVRGRLRVCRERRLPAKHSRWRTASRRRAPFHRGTSAMAPRSQPGAAVPRRAYQARSTAHAGLARGQPAVRLSGRRAHRAAREGRRLARVGSRRRPRSLGFDDEVRDRVENTRADFETAFKALAASAPAIIAASTVTSTADFMPNGRRVIVSGVVQYRGDGPVMRPYLLAGIGAATSFGDPATLTLTGTYRFTPPGRQPSKKPTRCGSPTRPPVLWCGFLAAA